MLTLRGAGWVASANFVGYLLGALAASRIPGRLAQSRGLRAGLAVSVLALLAMSLLDGIVAWMAVRFVAGMASAFALVFVSTQVLERLSAIGQADRTIWLYSGVGIGIVVVITNGNATENTSDNLRNAYEIRHICRKHPETNTKGQS